MSPMHEAADTLLAGGWAEDSILLDEVGAASLSPRWSATLTWSPRGEMRGEGWTATVQRFCVTVALIRAAASNRCLCGADLTRVGTMFRCSSPTCTTPVSGFACGREDIRG